MFVPLGMGVVVGMGYGLYSASVRRNFGDWSLVHHTGADSLLPSESGFLKLKIYW
jgi:hypothetical protein